MSDRLKQATEWFVEWEAAGEIPLTGEQLQAWRGWAGDTENLAAFDRIVRLREDVRQVAVAALPTHDELASDVVEVDKKAVRSRRWVPLAAAAGVAVVAVAAALVSSLNAPDYATGRAEQRLIRMEDGSTVMLGGQTTVTIKYTGRERVAVLRSGEALFRVARDADRPFVVRAGAGLIRALGTEFVVKRDTDRIVVTVTDGRVEVAPSRASEPLRLLARGEQVAFGERSAVGAIKKADPQAATAWSQGRLVFDHEPLRYVVQAVNRYATRQVELDENAGALLYTGMVLQDQTDEWIRGLQKIFPLEVAAKEAQRVSLRLQTQH